MSSSKTTPTPRIESVSPLPDKLPAPLQAAFDAAGFCLASAAEIMAIAEGKEVSRNSARRLASLAVHLQRKRDQIANAVQSVAKELTKTRDNGPPDFGAWTRANAHTVAVAFAFEVLATIRQMAVDRNGVSRAVPDWSDEEADRFVFPNLSKIMKALRALALPNLQTVLAECQWETVKANIASSHQVLTVGQFLAELSAGRYAEEFADRPGINTLRALAQAWYGTDLTVAAMKRLRFEGALRLAKYGDDEDRDGIDLVSVQDLAIQLRAAGNRPLDLSPPPLDLLDTAQRRVLTEGTPPTVQQREGSGESGTPKPTAAERGEGADESGVSSKSIPSEEANIIVRDYISKREKKGEDVTARDVKKDCGVALGRVPKFPAWQAYQARKAKPPQSRKPKENRQLSGKMLSAIGKENDPSARLADTEEAAWRYLLDIADSPKERGRLNAMTPAEKAEAIQLVIDQFTDQDNRREHRDP